MIKAVVKLSGGSRREEGRRERYHWELGGRAAGDLALELSGIGGKRWINSVYAKKPVEYRWEKGGRHHRGLGA